MNAPKPLDPGATIGILGGGQLGRMLAVAAAQLGFKVMGYAPAGDNVAADLCSDFVEQPWSHSAALSDFAARCDVVTWEFENVPIASLAAIAPERLRPGAKALEVAQDRLAEKRFVEKLGGQAAPFVAVDSDADLPRAITKIGAPGILKTRRDGYDGKGQWRLASADEAPGLRFPGRPCVYEGFVDFEAEFSVILARGADGATVFWDSSQNEHVGGILAASTCPPGAHVAGQIAQARTLAAQIAAALDYVGVLTLEFFATRAGPVFNEMAPRVHNSGHWTIEGAATSQFENHIRAIAGLPLGPTQTLFDAIEMRNIIGSDATEAFDHLRADSRTHLHLYGKSQALDGRKMGHVTRLGQEV